MTCGNHHVVLWLLVNTNNPCQRYADMDPPNNSNQSILKLFDHLHELELTPPDVVDSNGQKSLILKSSSGVDTHIPIKYVHEKIARYFLIRDLLAAASQPQEITSPSKDTTEEETLALKINEKKLSALDPASSDSACNETTSCNKGHHSSNNGILDTAEVPVDLDSTDICPDLSDSVNDLASKRFNASPSLDTPVDCEASPSGFHRVTGRPLDAPSDVGPSRGRMARSDTGQALLSEDFGKTNGIVARK